MAIKIKGDTIIDDGRVIVNADKIGIGTTNPQVALEIFSGDVGIGTTNPNASNIKESLDSNTNILAVGIITAKEIYGTFKGTVNPTPPITLDKIEEGNSFVEVVDPNSDTSAFIKIVVAGTEKQRILSSGVVNIKNVEGTGLNISGSNGVGIELKTVNSSVTEKRDAHLKIINEDNNTIAKQVGRVQSDGGSAWIWETQPSGNRSARRVERLRITADGHVGIGTTLPEVAVVAGNDKILAVGIVTANEYYGTFKGTIDSGVGLAADTVKTVTSTSGATHYLTFVDSDNLSETSESVYTDGGITYQPDVNRLGIGTIKPGQILDSGNGSGTLNYVIKADGEGGWTWGQIEGGSVGVVSFTDLNDTPSTYNSSANKLVAVNTGTGGNGTGLEFIDATAVGVGRTYSLETAAVNDDVKLRLKDEVDNTFDDILITKGTGITFGSVTADGFTISASGSGTGTLTDLDVKQFSGHHGSTPRTERSCSNPIDVTVDSTAGIATIGIGSTSNAYGRRYIQSIEPSTDVCEGDIWFDTSSSSMGSTKVAVLRDEKSAGTYGGKVGTGDYTGKRAYYNGVDTVLDVWFPRVLNTKYDSYGFVSLSTGVESGNQYSNTFALDPGKYKISWRVPAHQVDRFQSRLAYNTNDDFSGTTSYYYGTSQYSGVDPSVSGGGNASDSEDESEGEFIADISATTYFRIEQWIYSTGQSGTFGDGALGVAVSRNSSSNTNLNLGNTEVYTQVKIEDLATAVKDGGGVGIGSTNKIEQGNTKAEVIDTNSNGYFLVETENTERLRITSTGQLNLAGDMQFTAANPELEFNNGGPRFRVPSANTLAIHKGGGLGTIDNEVVRITQGGNVGIGTTNPDAAIETQNNTKLAVAGIVTAFKYYGDGSSLTNVSASAGGSIKLLPEKPSTSGTEVVFDNIPSDALEITLMFTGVSASGSNNFMVQLGTASGYIETGYDSLSQSEGGGDDTGATDCFLIRADANNHLRTGAMVITKASGSSYVQTGSFALNPSGVQGGTQTYGSLTSVSGTVDRLRVKLNGANTFDAGTMSVSYKTSGGSPTTGSVLGQVVAWGGNISSIPSEFVLCDGRELDKTTYSDLFAILGTIHNVGGEPSNVFRVPDLRDKFVVGSYSDGAGTTFPQVSVGATGGSRYTTLPEHYHNFPGDDQLSAANNTTGGTQGVQATWTSTSDNNFSYDANSTLSGSGKMWRTTSVGTGTENTNLPPYYALAYIINVTGNTVTASVGIGSTTKIQQGDTSAEVIDTGTDGRFVVKTENTERLRITGIGSVGIGTDSPIHRFSVFGNTNDRERFAVRATTGTSFNPDTISDIILNNAGGGAEATQVKGVINMGTSYKDGTLYAGSGHWSALKLFLYKDSNPNNIYGLGLSNGVMEIQSNADIAFFVGRDSTTTASGSRTERIRITRDGHLLPGADNTQDLGATNLRWDNVYHTDLHLDNTGCGGNEVDGTEGSWKIQEGADNLFLINKITGKKYKINMTEVT